MKNFLLVRNIYILIFISLISWSYFAFYTMSEQIEKQKNYAKLINLSGKQRMLSQKTTLIAKRIFESQDSTLISHFDEIFNIMQEDHTFIINNITSKNISNIYFGNPYNLDYKVKEYFKLLDLFKKDQDSETIEKIQNYSFNLLPNLNHVVYEFEKESDEQTNILLEREFNIFLGTLITLFLESILIVIPILRNIKKKEIELFNINQSLENKIQEEIIKIKKQDEIILQQSKMSAMGDVLKNIAHQWRQPLSVISTAASGIRLKKDYNILTNDEIEELSEQIITNSNYLSNTIEDFEKYFYSDSNKEKFLLKEFCSNVTDFLATRIKNNNINLKINIDDKLSIYGYKNELFQVFINIINNAIDSFETVNNKENLFFINITKKTDYIDIEFIDNAGGIPNEIKDKIFEAYFTTKHQYQGAGLGLYMSYQIISHHFNGVLDHENIAIDFNNTSYTGSKFHIKIY